MKKAAFNNSSNPLKNTISNDKSFIFRRFIVFLFAFITIPAIVFAQSDKNYSKYDTDKTLKSNARVNPTTLAMEFSIPIPSYPGRAGTALSGALAYSSKVWESGPTSQFQGQLITVKSLYPVFGRDSYNGWTSSLDVPRIDVSGEENYFEGGTIHSESDDPTSNPPSYPLYYIRRYHITMPDGSVHELREDDGAHSYGTTTSPGAGNAPLTGVFLSVDGSRMRLEMGFDSNNQWHNVLYLPDGSRYLDLPQKYVATSSTVTFIDRSGNQMFYNLTNKKWTDTMGRLLENPLPKTGEMPAPTSETTQTFSYPGLSSDTQQIQLVWKKLDTQQSTLYYIAEYSCSGNNTTNIPSGTSPLFTHVPSSQPRVCGNTTPFDPVLLTEIKFPNGSSYKFHYNVYGEIDRIDYPTGGYERFEYANLPKIASVANANYDQFNRGVVNRWISPDGTQAGEIQWHYEIQRETTSTTQGPYHVKTFAPDGTWSETLLKDRWSRASSLYGLDDPELGSPYEVRTYNNTTSNTLLRRTLTVWTSTGPVTVNGVTGVSNATRDLRPLKVFSVFIEPGSSSALVSKTETVYDTSGTSDPAYFSSVNPKQVKTYNYASINSTTAANGDAATLDALFSGSNPAVISEADYLYDSNYKARNIAGLTTESRIKDGSGNVKAKGQTSYDESSYFLSSSGTMPAAAANSWVDLTLSTQLGSVIGSKRGLPTSVRKFYDVSNSNSYIETHVFYDQFGNPRKARNARGYDIETVFDDDYAFAYPTWSTTAAPDENGTYGSSSAFTTWTTYNYNTGLPLTSTDANGLETRTEYNDSMLRPTKISTYSNNQEVGAETIPEYGSPDTTGSTAGQYPVNQRFIKVKTQIDENNWSQGYNWFDGIGRLIKTQSVDSKGDVFTETEYDSMGRVKRSTNPYRSGETKYWTTPTYDELGRTTLVTFPDSSTVQTSFGLSTSSNVGLTKTVTDQAARQRTGISDALGRTIRVIEDPNGQNLATDYKFDTLSNLRKTTQGSQYRYFLYDDLGRLLYAKQPEQEANTSFNVTDPITNNTQWSVKYEYDGNSNIIKTTDAMGTYVEGTYDRLDRLTHRHYSDSTPEVWFYYDGKGLPSVPDFSKGQVTKVTSSVSETKNTSFDNFGRLLTNQQITDGQTYDFAYSYNLSGALIEETYPSGRKVKTTLNSDGDLSMVQSKKNSNSGYYTYATGFDFNSAGSLNKMRLGNGHWENYVYNERLQIKQIGLGLTAATQDFLKLEYEYNTTGNHDNNGAILSQKITVPNSTGGNDGFTANQTYTYDALNRLHSAEEIINNSQTWKQTFSYDRYGNRWFDTGNNNTTTLSQSSPVKVTNPSVGESDNRLQKFQDNDSYVDYDYDKNGNLILDADGKRYGYDAENHQKTFFAANNNTTDPNVTYSYDGNGRRIKTISSTETVVFVYDGLGNLAAEYSTKLSQTPRVSYLTTDHLGSPRIITNESGAVTKRQDFSAFGEETITSQRTARSDYSAGSELREGYTGYLKDESGLDYAQARYYNHSHGRFTSVDPLTASANVKNPQTFNRYSYALNSPYKFIDPLGLAARAAGQPSRARGTPRTSINFNTIGEVTVINPYPIASGGGNSLIAHTSGTQEHSAAPLRSPLTPLLVQYAEGETQQESNPPEVNAEFGTSSVFTTEQQAGGVLFPPSFQNIGQNPVTDTQIKRRWNVSATMRLVDRNGNELKDFEYEISYPDSSNPDPDFNRVKGKQSTNNGEAFLGTFVLAERRCGTQYTDDQSSYNDDQTIPSNTKSGLGTIKLFSKDGSTATIDFEVSVDNKGVPKITPENTQVKWVKPSK